MIRAFLSFSLIAHAIAIYGTILLGLGLMVGLGLDAGALFLWARNLALFIVIVVVGVFGLSFKGAPWRRLWRRYPALNELVGPDINGVWLGETRSNWPRIDALRKAASVGTPIDSASIDDIPLKIDPIAFEIRAHWFGIRLRAKTHAENGDAFARDVKFERGVRGRDFEIAYIYEQNTPNQKHTDESMHPGAATLEVKLGKEIVLDGEYWTRRAWAQGLNTAGLLRLKRVSEDHLPRSVDLLQEAQRLAETNTDKSGGATS